MADHDLTPSHPQPPHVYADIEPSEDELMEKLGGSKRKKYARFAVAALSSIPWIGGVISAAASLSAEKDQESINVLQRSGLRSKDQNT